MALKSMLIGSKVTAPPSTAPTLRAVPPQLPAAPAGTGNFGARLLGVSTAIRFNATQAAGQAVAPTNSSDPNVGQAGSDGNAGNIAGAGAAGASYGPTEVYFGVFGIPSTIATVARIALPVAGIYLFSQGSRILGGAMVAASLPLWARKLGY